MSITSQKAMSGFLEEEPSVKKGKIKLKQD